MQMQLTFDFCTPKEQEVDMIAEYAKTGTLMENGKERIKKFFLSNPSQNEMISFLKEEYGTGGFSEKCCCNSPFKVYAADYNSKGHKFSYYNEDMQETIVQLSHNALAKKITELIAAGEY